MTIFIAVTRSGESVAVVAERYSVPTSTIHGAIHAVREKSPELDREYRAAFPKNFRAARTHPKPDTTPKKSQYSSDGVMRLALQYAKGIITRAEMARRMKAYEYGK